MKKLKVVVYAICKNESDNIEKWVSSMSEADDIYVLDTGSTDDSVEKLKRNGVLVFSEEITPWRFDTARNKSLDMLPADCDICVCTDLDEVFHKGWRENVEKAWTGNVNQLRYRYTWNFNEDLSEGTVFYIEKIHARNGFRWKNPVHEVIEYVGDAECACKTAEGIQLDHHADPKKQRSQYLPLLELAVKEDPMNDRNVHYLGREYMFRSMYQMAIITLKAHLALPTAKWVDERCASMRYIAMCYDSLGDNKNAVKYFLSACSQAPHLREPWLDFAVFCYKTENWYAVITLLNEALKITERPNTYISEARSWGNLAYDLQSLAFYYTGDYQSALNSCIQALKITPFDERILKNKELYEAKVKENNLNI